MIRLKNEKQIASIRESCHLLATMFETLKKEGVVQVGMETREIDQWVHKWITAAGGKPAFLGYEGYPGSICISVNEEVIHGIPGKRVIRDGDLVSLDCGIDLGGFISDQAITLMVGNVSEEAKKLVKVTEESLYKGIEQAKAGNRVHAISRAVQDHVKPFGYGVVYQYCGHGVGFSCHEDPQIPNYVGPGANPRLGAGMVIAIEPMINLGTADVEVLEDDWTVVTADDKLSAHWEHTVAIFEDHTEILTKL